MLSHTCQPEELSKEEKTKYMLKSEEELSLKGKNRKFSAKIFFFKGKIDYKITNVNKQYNKMNMVIAWQKKHQFS